MTASACAHETNPSTGRVRDRPLAAAERASQALNDYLVDFAYLALGAPPPRPGSDEEPGGVPAAAGGG